MGYCWKKKIKIRKKKNVRTRLWTSKHRYENELWIRNLRQTGIDVREREGLREERERERERERETYD